MKFKKAISRILLLAIIMIAIGSPDLVYGKEKKLALDWIIDPQISCDDIVPVQYDTFTGKKLEENFSAYSFVKSYGQQGSVTKNAALIDYKGKESFQWKEYMYLSEDGLHVYDTREQRDQGGALSISFLYNSKLKIKGSRLTERGEILYYVDTKTGKFCEYWAGYGVSQASYSSTKPKTGIYQAIELAEVADYSEWNYKELDYSVMLNAEGKMIKNSKYEDGKIIQEGLILAKKNGKWGYIDGKGKKVIPFQYDAAYSFRDGKAAVKKNGKWGYIYKDGSTCVGFVLEEARPAYQGKGWAKKGGYWGLLNLSGKKVDKITYKGNIYTKPNPSYVNGFYLEEGKTAYYDLDGDGKKEAVRYKESGKNSSYGYIKGIELYVNNKKVMEKKKEALGYSVWIYDIDKNDSRLDIYISGNVENGYSAYQALGRYNKGKYETIKVFKDGNKTSELVVSKKQDGTFLCKSGNSSNAICNYSLNVSYRIKDNKLYKGSSTVGDGSQPYMLKTDVNVYAKSDKTSDAIFKLSYGDIVTISAITKKDGTEYLYIKTLNGKKGWIYTNGYNELFNNVYWVG